VIGLKLTMVSTMLSAMVTVVAIATAADHGPRRRPCHDR
jgi:hypothetical protein